MPEPTLVLRGATLPAPLAALERRCAALYVAGTWPDAPWVAIVGARAATPYGLGFAHRLAGDLAKLGVVIASGLARGIDAAAHEGALAAGGRTVAVLPGSLDRVTPPEHAALATRIAARGALVAEYERGIVPRAGRFLERNRLIAALSLATVVVEAAERSGALSTASVARTLGRPVLAVPGDVDRPSSRGCHALLRRGARVCEGAADVLEAIRRGAGDAIASPALAQSAVAPAGATVVPPPAARLAAALDAEPRTLDQLAARAGLDPAAALATLLELEWSGLAAAQAGARWTARAAT
jgi:DNA processing protein